MINDKEIRQFFVFAGYKSWFVGLKFVAFITIVIKIKMEVDFGWFLQIALRFKELLFDVKSKSDSVFQKWEASQVHGKIWGGGSQVFHLLWKLNL